MPTPQELRFAVTAVYCAPTPTWILIIALTNHPCHLWLRYTTVVPQKHIHARIVRGAQAGTYIDQCFVAYTDLEQLTPGDTTVHYFLLEPWSPETPRWFYFWGTVQGVASPSASAIFKNCPIILSCYEFTPHKESGFDSCDGHVSRVLANQTWGQIHDGPGNQSTTDHTTDEVHLSAFVNPNTWDGAHRLIMTFPTQPIPDNFVLFAASIQLYCRLLIVDPPLLPAIGVFGSTPAQYNDLQDSDFGQCQDIPCSPPISCSSFSPGSFITIPLNAYGLSKINKSGVTKFSIREANYDAPNLTPPWAAHADVEVQLAMADHETPAWRPVLKVYYSL